MFSFKMVVYWGSEIELNGPDLDNLKRRDKATYAAANGVSMMEVSYLEESEGSSMTHRSSI